MMNKKELIHAIAAKASSTNAEAAKMLDAVLDTIEDALRKNDPVQIMGFGTFKTIHRAEKMGKRPGTGAPMKIPARTLAKYVPSKKMRSL
jgi:DNA-binding protein HU-beta